MNQISISTSILDPNNTFYPNMGEGGSHPSPPCFPLMQPIHYKTYHKNPFPTLPDSDKGSFEGPFDDIRALLGGTVAVGKSLTGTLGLQVFINSSLSLLIAAVFSVKLLASPDKSRNSAYLLTWWKLTRPRTGT